MLKTSNSLFGRKVGSVRVFPLVLKIIVLFTIFLITSNYATNYLNLILNRGQMIKLMNQLLVKDLKELYVFSSNQFDIYEFNQDYGKAVNNIRENALKELKYGKSLAVGIKSDGSFLFQASNLVELTDFDTGPLINDLLADKEKDILEGSVRFKYKQNEYFGVYKYVKGWDSFLFRLEEQKEFYAESTRIFRNVSFLILVLALLFSTIGIFLLRRLFRFVDVITESIMEMQKTQKLTTIDLEKAPNDDVTYLGMSFNALVNTIDNLLNIFKRFVTTDTARKAYQDQQVYLQGEPRDLTMLFTDIKGFTYMTETLGSDIINLLNMHYENAIHHIHERDGIIGSIIGDALLAVFGTLEDAFENRSYQALQAAYKIQDVADELRRQMEKKKLDLEKRNGALTPAELKVYRAVLLEVGVGIDSGNVFYGNLGSYIHMTTTVIGDYVNSASRLEGLTRVYQVPVICSEEVKNDVEPVSDEFVFLELDTVQVKGKTIGKKVYFPIMKTRLDPAVEKQIPLFQSALQMYYDGQWRKANALFNDCTLSCAEVFKERTQSTRVPKDWNGIWTMTSK